MPQIVTEELTIYVSRVAKKGQELEPLVNDEVAANVEAVVQELIGDASAVVEVVKNG